MSVCRAHKTIKNGFYHNCKLYFIGTCQTEVSLQRYKCKKCGKNFQADLSEIVDKNSNFTNEIKEKATYLVGTYYRSLHNVSFIKRTITITSKALKTSYWK